VLYAPGIAMLQRLLSDGTGPAYWQRADRTLAQALSEAHAALRGAARPRGLGRRV
jgi:hypothetical protein